MFSLRKIGGMRFLRLGRIQISWCVVKPESVERRRYEADLRRAKRNNLRRLARYYANQFARQTQETM